MTLIVGKIIEGNIYIESDSKVTDKSIVGHRPLCGALKTLIIHPFVCFSFAGNVDYAERALNLFFERKIEDVNLLLSMLLEVHNDSDRQTDFAVATITNKEPHLFKISNGHVETGISHFWLGDLEGFKLYQKEFHQLEETKPVKSRMREAFQRVITESSLPSIGDFHISTYIDYKICSEHPVFLHDLKFNIDVSEPQIISFEENKQAKALSLGTAEGGSHGISYLVTVCPDYHGVAIHFTHGNFGIIFCPQISFQGLMIKEVNGQQFVKVLKEQYGIPLRGFVRGSSSSMQFIDSRCL